MLQGKKVGIAITGSFCTLKKIIPEIRKLTDEEGAKVYTIFSDMSKNTDTRFGKAEEFYKNMENITNNKPITTITEAEVLGPDSYLDIMAIFPCTGNTLAKLANGITDTPVLMAAKAHLRNEKPLVISVSTNDALGMNMKNIGELMNVKNIFFVPFGQDNYKGKPNSMIADTKLLIPAIYSALEKKQLQPVIIHPN